MKESPAENPHSSHARGVVVRAEGLSKSYDLWNRPAAALGGRIMRALGNSSLLPRRARAFYGARADATRHRFAALTDLTFEIRAGEAWGVIGRNGSGKSTLLQIVAGTLAPTAGHVDVSGQVAALLELGSGFHPEFTGRENVRLGASILGLAPDEVERRLGSITAFADIGDFLDRAVKTYSSGMLMRLAFATATSVEPDVLLIDESLAVGDAGFQFKCFEALTRFVGDGGTLLLVSHDIVAVRALCDYALYLDGGRCRAQGPVDEVAEAYLMDFREEQRRASGATTPLVPRRSLGGRGLLSFGGSDGRIESARFLASGASRAALARGEDVDIEVVLSLEAAKPWVHLCLLILSDRRIPIAGHRAPVTGEHPQDAGLHRLLFRFPARLAPGRYFMNLRLEHGLSPSTSLVIEKQTAALELEILPDGGTELLGFCDLGIEVSVGSVPAEHSAEVSAP